MDGQPTKCGGPLYWFKRRSRRFWIIATALLPVFYVASFGPTCWLICWLNRDTDAYFEPPFIFIPLMSMMENPDFDDTTRISGMLYAYSLLGTDGSWTWWGDPYSGLGKKWTGPIPELAPPAPSLTPQPEQERD